MHKPRVFAIDLRPQRFGYAVFEGRERLLDWGVVNYRPGGDIGAAMAGKRTEKLVAIFLPAVIVVKSVRRKVSRKNDTSVRPILRAIRRIASMQEIPVRLIARADVRMAFRTYRVRTKYEIACALTVIFPELLWRLPSERKIYESERSAMTIFDAVALGFTYWQMLDPSLPSTDPEPSNPFAGPAGDEQTK